MFDVNRDPGFAEISQGLAPRMSRPGKNIHGALC